MRKLQELGITQRSAVTDADIAAAEAAIGHRLPEDFRTFVRHCDEASPQVAVFRCGHDTTCISEFFRVSGDAGQWSLRYYARQRPPDLSRAIVPFARDPGDDLICFDYSESEQPSIVLYRHEDRSLVFVALSFQAFIDSLTNGA